MVYKRFSRLLDLYPVTTFVGHFLDTQKIALANVKAAMEAGVTKFDSSVGGLGWISIFSFSHLECFNRRIYKDAFAYGVSNGNR